MLEINKPCKVEDCIVESCHAGFCNKHYQQQNKLKNKLKEQEEQKLKQNQDLVKEEWCCIVENCKLKHLTNSSWCEGHQDWIFVKPRYWEL